MKSLGREALLVQKDKMFTRPIFVTALYRVTIYRLSKRVTTCSLDAMITLELWYYGTEKVQVK